MPGDSGCRYPHSILAINVLKYLDRLEMSKIIHMGKSISSCSRSRSDFSPNLKLLERRFTRNTWKTPYVSQPFNIWHNLKDSKGEKLWPRWQSKGGMGTRLHWELGPWGKNGAKMLLHFAYWATLGRLVVAWGHLYPLLEDYLEDRAGWGDCWILRSKGRKS